MPIDIYRVTPDDQEDEHIAWLCDGEWLLWRQAETLSEWLKQSSAGLPPGEYVADIGFCWRRSAGTGGPVIDPVTMKRMADLGMSLHLSEYPGFAEETQAEEADQLNKSPKEQSGDVENTEDGRQ